MPASKEEIADTFWRLSEKYGYRRATIADVAAALRISKKTIYEYYPDKKVLYRQALKQWALAQRKLVESLLTKQSARDRVEQIARIAFAHAREGFRTAQHEDDSEPADIMERVNAHVFTPLIQSLIEEGNASGEFQVKQPCLIATFCVAIGMAAVRKIRDDRAEHPEDDAIQAMLKLISIDD